MSLFLKLFNWSNTEASSWTFFCTKSLLVLLSLYHRPETVTGNTKREFHTGNFLLKSHTITFVANEQQCSGRSVCWLVVCSVHHLGSDWNINNNYKKLRANHFVLSFRYSYWVKSKDFGDPATFPRVCGFEGTVLTTLVLYVLYELSQHLGRAPNGWIVITSV